MPREPSSPRVTVWRKLQRLGVAQLSDGLVALPADTRTGVHVDRAACAWLIGRNTDKACEFIFVADPSEVPSDAVPFDMPGVDLTHHGHDCTFETMLRRYDIEDPVLWKLAEIIHEADIDDERYDAPAAPGLDIIIRGLSMTLTDEQILAVCGPVLDGLYEYLKRSLILGREPE